MAASDLLDMLAEEGAGALDTARVVGGNALLSPVAGLYGFGSGMAAHLRALRNGKGLRRSAAEGWDTAANTINDTMELGPAPRTVAGVKNLQAIGNIVDALRNAPGVKQVADKAVEATDWIGEQSPALGAAIVGAANVASPGGKVKSATSKLANITLKDIDSMSPGKLRKLLLQHGKPVSPQDAQRLFGDGYVLFGAHEMDELPFRLKTPSDVDLYSDDLLALPPPPASAPSKASNSKSSVVSVLRGYDPAKVARDYPDRSPPVQKIDPKTGKEFLGKDLSEEAKAVQKARQAAQKEIDAGNYTPMFPIEERFYVDASNYPLVGNTLTDAMPKKQATIDNYKKRFDTPEIRKRLQVAFLRGNADPNAQRWYAMGQLEKVYVDELGPEAGRKAFKTDFADAMAATTGGADPTDNLMMAHYGNVLRARGERVPENAFDMPFPIGGRYAGGNMRMYDKVINQGRDFVASETPKRFNFSANFQGHKDRATIDEQMSGGFEKGLAVPPGDSYGVMERVVADIAKRNKVPSAEAQDVMWAGLKGTKGKPMIQHVNEAIERTARITGLSPEEVLRQNLIRKLGPLYGIGAASVGTAALMGQEDDSL